MTSIRTVSTLKPDVYTVIPTVTQASLLQLQLQFQFKETSVENVGLML